MKKLFYLLLIVGLAVTSCNKPEQLPLEQDVTFKAVAFESGFKAGDICTSDVAHYAVLKIQPLKNGTIDPDKPEFEEILDIFYLNGTMYTNTLKLNAGSYKLNSFVLMNYGTDNAFGDTTTDGSGVDVIVYASPVDGSPNADIVEGLPLTFDVGIFTKNEVNLEVLCFDEASYTDFGFSWFAINFTNVGNNDLVFFGDFCTKYFEDYVGSLYENQANGLRHDMPAIFRIEVLNITDPSDPSDVGIYNNIYHENGFDYWLGVGAPLVVPSPDDPSINNEIFEFVLSIYVKVGAGFQIKEFARFTSNDAGDLNEITKGIDGVYDFVLGSCVPDADLVLPPYMNLPANATVEFTNPGTISNSYWDIYLSNIGAGFDIANTLDPTEGEKPLPGFCGDHGTTIGNGPMNLNVYSSLYPGLIPASFDSQIAVMNNINWLGNHLANYPGYVWQDVQDAVWKLIDPSFGYDYDTENDYAATMVSDAIAQGNNYMPPVGGYAAVLFISPDATDNDRDLQLIFTLVDP